MVVPLSQSALTDLGVAALLTMLLHWVQPLPNWDDPEERNVALVGVLEALEAVEAYLSDDGGPGPEASAGIRIARRVREQDVLPAEEAPGRLPVLRRGVARERLVSVEDPQMRHGRKSRSTRFDG